MQEAKPENMSTSGLMDGLIFIKAAEKCRFATTRGLSFSPPLSAGETSWEP